MHVAVTDAAVLDFDGDILFAHVMTLKLPRSEVAVGGMGSESDGGGHYSGTMSGMDMISLICVGLRR